MIVVAIDESLLEASPATTTPETSERPATDKIGCHSLSGWLAARKPGDHPFSFGIGKLGSSSPLVKMPEPKSSAAVLLRIVVLNFRRATSDVSYVTVANKPRTGIQHGRYWFYIETHSTIAS